MKKNYVVMVGMILVVAAALSACTGAAPTNNWPGLAADSERAYLSAGPFVQAIDLADGTEAWKYPEKPDNKDQFYSALAVTEDGQLLVGSAGTRNGFLSLDPETGRQNWVGPFMGAKGIWLAPPLMWNGVIYAPNSDGWLYMLDETGRLLASVELGGALWSQPVTDGTLVYVASLDHHIHAIDPVTQQVVQTVDLGGAIPGRPAATTDGVYVGSFSGKMELISGDGRRETLSVVEDWIWAGPALDDKTLYFADLSGKLYSIDTPSGRQNWGALQPDGPIAATPLVMGDKLIVVTESGTVFAFDRQGADAWPRPYQTGGKIYTAPVAAGDLILVAPFQGNFQVAALDSDGKQVWLFGPAGD